MTNHDQLSLIMTDSDHFTAAQIYSEPSEIFHFPFSICYRPCKEDLLGIGRSEA